MIKFELRIVTLITTSNIRIFIINFCLFCSFAAFVAVERSSRLRNYWTTVQKLWPKPLEAGSLGDRFIVLRPQKTITTQTKEESQEQQTQSEVYKRITCSVPGVEPLSIGTIWFPEAPAKSLQQLIIHSTRVLMWCSVIVLGKPVI